MVNFSVIEVVNFSMDKHTVNVQIMRAFVRLREILAENADLSRRLDDLEQRYDEQFKIIIQAIQALTAPQVRERDPVGFRP